MAPGPHVCIFLLPNFALFALFSLLPAPKHLCCSKPWHLSVQLCLDRLHHLPHLLSLGSPLVASTVPPILCCLNHGFLISGSNWFLELFYCLMEWNAQLLSRVWPFVTLWTIASQLSLSMEFPRQEYLGWVAISYSSGSSWSRDPTYVLCILHWRQILYHCHLGSPLLPQLDCNF